MNNDFERQQNEPVQPLNKKQLKICNNFNCGYKTYQPVSRCPKCGRPIWTMNETRMLMSLFIPLGGFLVAVGAGIIILIEYNIASGKSTWKGNDASLYFVYALLGAVAAFGISVVSFGLWCVIFGRPSKGLFKIMVSIFMGLLVLVGFARLIITLLSD